MALNKCWNSNAYCMDKNVNNINTAANAVIKYKVDAGTLSNTNANILRKALIRILTHT